MTALPKYGAKAWRKYAMASGEEGEDLAGGLRYPASGDLRRRHQRLAWREHGTTLASIRSPPVLCVPRISSTALTSRVAFPVARP